MSDGQQAADVVRRDWPVAASLVAAVLLAYGPVLWFDFTLDDWAVIVRNDVVHQWSGLWESWTRSYWPVSEGGFDRGLYRPLMGSLFTLCWQIGQGAPWAFHTAGLAAHLTVTLGAWRWLARAVGAIPAAFGVAWFALHPSRVEAVASAVGLAEVLVAGWVVLAVHIATTTDDHTGWRGWRRALALAGCYLGATATKESGLLLPGLVWIAWMAVRPLRPVHTGWRAWWAHWGAPWLRVGICWRVVAVGMGLARWVVAPRLTIAGVDGLVTLAPTARLWTMMQTWPAIVGALFVPPWALHAHVVDAALVPLLREATPQTWGVLAVRVLWSGGALWGLWRGHALLAALTAWIVLAVLPASNLLLVTTQLFRERTLYTARLSRAPVVAAAVAWLLGRVPRPRWVLAGMGVILTTLANSGQEWLLEWRANATLFAGAARRHPHSPIAWHHLSQVQAQADALPAAMLRNAMARQLWPRREEMWYSGLRLATAARSRTPETLAMVEESRRRFPTDFQRELLELTWRRATFGLEDAMGAIARGLGRHAPVTFWLQTMWLLEAGDGCRARASWAEGVARYPRDVRLRRLGSAHAAVLEAPGAAGKCRTGAGETPNLPASAGHR